MVFGRFFPLFFACMIFVAASGCQFEVGRPGKVSDPSKTVDPVPAVEPSPATQVPAPESVPERTAFRALDLAVGSDHTCAIDMEGKVWCWGSNSDGQLGRGTADADRPEGVPGLVEGVDNAIRVVTGQEHSCALISDGTVKCWGGAHLKGVENPTGNAPEQVEGVELALQIAAGGNHTCARLVDGTVKCWGMNGRGQIGDGTRVPIEVLPLLHQTPQKVVDLVNIVQISAGSEHSCAVDSSGGVWCWGGNNYWQTGVSNPSQPAFVMPHASPVRPEWGTALPSLSGARVSAGGVQSCVLTQSKAIVCWGRKFVNGPVEESDEVRTTAFIVETTTGDDEPFLTLSAGYSHVCGTLFGGRVKCWGSNFAGHLGDGSTEYRTLPTPVVGLEGAVIVRSGAEHTCAISRDNIVQCWGSNRSGQLGDGTVISRSVPGPVFQN